MLQSSKHFCHETSFLSDFINGCTNYFHWLLMLSINQTKQFKVITTLRGKQYQECGLPQKWHCLYFPCDRLATSLGCTPPYPPKSAGIGSSSLATFKKNTNPHTKWQKTLNWSLHAYSSYICSGLRDAGNHASCLQAKARLRPGLVASQRQGTILSRQTKFTLILTSMSDTRTPAAEVNKQLDGIAREKKRFCQHGIVIN